MRRYSFKTLRSYSVRGSFWSCENQSGRYCDWNSNVCWHGWFFSQIDPVTHKQFFFQHPPSLICIYIYLLCMGGLILTISPVLIFILLIKHKLVDPIQPHESFTMCVEYFSLKCLRKIITFRISSWLVDNSADIPSLESVSDIKVSYVDMFGSFTTWFPSIPFQLDCALIILFWWLRRIPKASMENSC